MLNRSRHASCRLSRDISIKNQREASKLNSKQLHLTKATNELNQAHPFFPHQLQCRSHTTQKQIQPERRFRHNRKGISSSPNRPGRVAVALVAPQQSVNIGAVSRLMATYGHHDLYISPQDAGYDAMCPGDMIVDFIPSNNTVSIQIAPLLSPYQGRSPRHVRNAPFEHDLHLETMNGDSHDIPLPLAPIMRFSDLPEDSTLDYFLSQIEADPTSLLPFLKSPIEQQVELEQVPTDIMQQLPKIKAYVTDRIGTRYSRTAALVNSFFPHSRLTIEVPGYMIAKEARQFDSSHFHQAPNSGKDVSLFKTLEFGFEISRIGVPQFQGPPSTMWAPYHAAYTVSHAVNSRDPTMKVQNTQFENVQLYISEDQPAGQIQDHNHNTAHSKSSIIGGITGAEDAASLFTPARLHPAVAISSTSYFAATKSGAEVLDNAKLFHDLGDLMSQFDVVIGTSAMFKTPPKRISPYRPVVMKPWELDWVNLTNYTSDDEVLQDKCGTLDDDKASSDPAQPSVLIVLGRESSGLTARELDMCDYLVTIPGPNQLGGTNFSLNLGQACGCILYEIARAQRLHTEVLEPHATWTQEQVQQQQQQQQIDPALQGTPNEINLDKSRDSIDNDPESKYIIYDEHDKDTSDSQTKSKYQIRYENIIESNFRTNLAKSTNNNMTAEGRANIWSISKSYIAQLDPRFTLIESPTSNAIVQEALRNEPPIYAGNMGDYYANQSGIKELDQSFRDVATEGRTALHPQVGSHAAGTPVPPSGRSHAEDYGSVLRKIISRSNLSMAEAKSWINLMKWSAKQIEVYRDTINNLSEQIRKSNTRQ